MNTPESIPPVKPWWQSQTILGALATAIVAAVGQLWKVDISDLKLDLVGGLIGTALLVTTGITIHGRIKAQSLIASPPSNPPGPGRILGLILCVTAALGLAGCTPWASTVGVSTATPYGTVSVSWQVGGATATPDKQIATPDKQLALPVK